MNERGVSKLLIFIKLTWKVFDLIIWWHLINALPVWFSTILVNRKLFAAWNSIGPTRNVNSTVKLFNNLHFTWSWVVQNCLKNTKLNAPVVSTRLFVLYYEIFFRTKSFMIYAMEWEKCICFGHIVLLYRPAGTTSVQKVKTKKLQQSPKPTEQLHFIRTMLWVLWIMGMRNGKRMCKITIFKRSYQIVSQMQ